MTSTHNKVWEHTREYKITINLNQSGAPPTRHKYSKQSRISPTYRDQTPRLSVETHHTRPTPTHAHTQTATRHARHPTNPNQTPGQRTILTPAPPQHPARRPYPHPPQPLLLPPAPNPPPRILTHTPQPPPTQPTPPTHLTQSPQTTHPGHLPAPNIPPMPLPPPTT